MKSEKYTILEEMRSEVDKKLKRLQKKAEKYGIPFATSSTEPYGYEVVDKVDGREVKRYYEVYDLTIESEEIKNGDYTVLARIEHTIGGNIVTVFSGEMQKEWACLPARCEHCNGNHGQKFTFIVDDGTNRKQVGRTCLKDYCGIDPQMVGMLNQFFEDIEEYTPERYEFGDGVIDYGYDSVEVLALAMMAVEKQGYRKSDEQDSNKDYIRDCLHHNEHPSKEMMVKAEELAEKIKALDVYTAVEFMMNNVQTRINGFYCKPSDFGYFAYAPVAYEKYERKMARMKERVSENEALAEKSEHVGTIGERATFNVKEAKLLTSWESRYGITYLYRFIDENDNVLIWFASTHIDENVATIKATVKDHSERDGIKQTIITRVKPA